MNQPTIKTALKLILAVIITFGLSLTLQSLLAQVNWTNPQCSPPGCNVPAPINIGSSTAPSAITQGVWSKLNVAASSTQITTGGMGVAGVFSVNSDQIFATLSSQGKVGIGASTSLSARLTVDIKNDWQMEGIHIRRAAGAPSYYSYLNIRNELDQPIFQVKEDGNVGIGTGSPAFKLDVNGRINASELCLSDGCKSAWSQVGGGGGNYSTSCFHGSLGQNYPGCCRMQITTGVTSCRIYDLGTSNWSNLPSPFQTPGTGPFTISCYSGSSSQNYLTCCKFYSITGASTCLFYDIGINLWSAQSAPWP